MRIQPTKVQHWPGGIPQSVLIHPDGDRSEEVEIEDSRGWFLFVQEEWKSREDRGIPEEDKDYELRQRRFLIERWASATQSFRDSYHTRAPSPNSPLDYPLAALYRIEETAQPAGTIFCLAPAGPENPTNYARWLKFQILLYRLDGEYGHILNPDETAVIAEQNPATARPEGLAKTEFALWAWLEPADFRGLSMTRSGMVRFLRAGCVNFLVDHEGLETGRLSLVEFAANGQIAVEMLRRPFNIIPVMRYLMGLGWGVASLKDENIGGAEWNNEPMEMDDPILDILETALDLSEMVDMDGDREQFAEDIELYAPGYLDMEATGRAAEYDVARLRSGEEAFLIWSAQD